MITINERYNLRTQTPDIEGNWLCKDEGANRMFCKVVDLAKEETPWAECSDADKQAWDEAHKLAEPAEVEDVQEAEVVE